MARPKADVDEVRARMMDAAEALLAESSGRRLVLSDVADRVGLSQSYAHRFFRTKADLVRALAERWFAAVEAECAAVCASPASPADRLRAFVLTILRRKRAQYDRDPALFRAYLRLAENHMDVVRVHTGRLTAMLRGIVAEMVLPGDVEPATDFVEDATLLFRVPAMIAQFRDRATDNRAETVLSALVRILESG